MIQFLQPNFLYFIVPIIFLVVFLYFKKSHTTTFSAFGDVKKIYKSHSFLYKLYYFLLMLVSIIGIIILAQPVVKNTEKNISKDGIDIMITLDVSLSMKAEDLQPNRIEAAKNILTKFLSKLESDRVGLVVFSGKPFTSLPLNFDYEVSKKIIQNVSTDILDQNVNGLNGTAIGDAIMFGFDSLGNTKNREKVLIIVTDGTANVGVDPKIAAQYVAENSEKLTIYTVGIGGKKPAFIRYTHPMGFPQKVEVEGVDEETLKEIAEIGNGKYYRATDTDTLENIFQEISKREKTQIESNIYESTSSRQNIFVLIFIVLLSSIFTLRIYKNF